MFWGVGTRKHRKWSTVGSGPPFLVWFGFGGFWGLFMENGQWASYRSRWEWALAFSDWGCLVLGGGHEIVSKMVNSQLWATTFGLVFGGCRRSSQQCPQCGTCRPVQLRDTSISLGTLIAIVRWTREVQILSDAVTCFHTISCFDGYDCHACFANNIAKFGLENV